MRTRRSNRAPESGPCTGFAAQLWTREMNLRAAYHAKPQDGGPCGNLMGTTSTLLPSVTLLNRAMSNRLKQGGSLTVSFYPFDRVVMSTGCVSSRIS